MPANPYREVVKSDLKTILLVFPTFNENKLCVHKKLFALEFFKGAYSTHKIYSHRGISSSRYYLTLITCDDGRRS